MWIPSSNIFIDRFCRLETLSTERAAKHHTNYFSSLGDKVIEEKPKENVIYT